MPCDPYWQSQLESRLISSGAIQKALVYSWVQQTNLACSPGFAPSPIEIATLIAAFVDADAIKITGFTLEGRQYIAWLVTRRSIYGRRSSAGVIAVKAIGAVVIGIYGDWIKLAAAVSRLESFADDLIESGF